MNKKGRKWLNRYDSKILSQSILLDSYYVVLGSENQPDPKTVCNIKMNTVCNCFPNQSCVTCDIKLACYFMLLKLVTFVLVHVKFCQKMSRI